MLVSLSSGQVKGRGGGSGVTDVAKALQSLDADGSSASVSERTGSILLEC
jgi:hypothetical protein